jgi:glucokinase
MKTGSRPDAKTFLVGDVGGTRARLALHRLSAPDPIREAVLESRSFASLEEAVATFLAGADTRPALAVLGIAGPVRDGKATATNLPWKVEERSLARKLRIPDVRILNDLVVAARGCLEVPAASVLPLTLSRPARRGKNLAVIAAGTGLGEARLVWDGARHLALATEGGHCDFAPRSPLEVELWHFLHGRHPDHVSYERVASGTGLGVLYDFFVSRGAREPQRVARRLAEGDRNAAIADLGLSRGSRPAARAVDLFASIYGAEAGNLALRELALGGIFVVGNIARRIVPEKREIFLEAFRKKGRFAAMLADVPLAVVTDPHVGVRGAVAIAREALGARRDRGRVR